MAEQPEALLALAERIAESKGLAISIDPQAAAELRSQHAEIERLRNDLAVYRKMVASVIVTAPAAADDLIATYEKGFRDGAAQPAPVQEPVAWMVIGDGEYGEYTPGTHFDTVGYKEYWERRGYELQPLYTTPPAAQRKPLTVEEVKKLIHPIVMADLSDEMTDFEIVRAIEAAHGIK